ncbi:MAG: transcriptional regulator [Bacteroidetes bacterium]|nr:MAG: transcriptional regulator [Bacteroidota bacterium]
MLKKTHKRSDCPVSRALDILGDKWTLLIIRDIVFGGFRFYNEFLNSGEGIATNVLSDRLKLLEQNGFIESKQYEKQRTKKLYLLTEKGIGLIPIVVELLIWGFDFDTSLPIPEDRKVIIARMKYDKENLIKEITESVRKHDSKNFC